MDQKNHQADDRRDHERELNAFHASERNLAPVSLCVQIGNQQMGLELLKIKSPPMKAGWVSAVADGRKLPASAVCNSSFELLLYRMERVGGISTSSEGLSAINRTDVPCLQFTVKGRGFESRA